MIASLKNGDHAAFSKIYGMYHKKIYFLVLSRTGSPYMAEEVTQLTFIKLWRNRASLDNVLPLDAQLFRIVKTTLIDLLRKDSTRLKLLRKEHSEALASASPELVLQQKELLRRVEQLVDRMPPMRKKVFQLSRNQGLSYAEISRQLSLSIKTVERHISLAIKDLRVVFLVVFLLFLFHA
jgi:RNA polymerase sigma-70 factor (family 1)